MLSTCFGLSLRTGTHIIAIINSIASICYIIYYIWEYNVSYEFPKDNKNSLYEQSELTIDEVFLNYITLIFICVGLTSLFASFGLKQATSTNATHKIYLWLLIGYVQFGTVITIEIVVLLKHTVFIAHNITGFIICFMLIDAALVYQLLIVQSFYKEEKLIEETNYKRLTSDLTSQIGLLEEEFQNVDL